MQDRRKPKWRIRQKKNHRLMILIIVLTSVLLIAIGAIVIWKNDSIFNMFFTPDIEKPVNEDNPVFGAVDGFDRREGVYNILVVGHDRVAVNTDVLMIVSFDSKNKKASIAQLPRDTYMDTVKVNSLYGIGMRQAQADGKNSEEADKAGIENLIDSIQKSLCITLDRYVLMDLEGFSNIVDIIGGVEMDVPFDMHYVDPDQDLVIDIKKGQQHLDGKTAEQFVRFRSGFAEADLGRENAQKLFMSAFFASAKKGIEVKNVTQLVDTVMKYLDTSMTTSDMAYFVRYGLELEKSDITTFTMPGIAARSHGDSGLWFYFLYRDDCISMINSYLNVYTTNLTADRFDPYTFLTNPNNATMYSYFMTQGTEQKVYSLDSVEQTIDIPLK